MTFSTATLTFLRGLKRHNDRAWFEGHRAEYEAVVQQPMRHLIEEMDVRLARLAPEIVGDPKRSLFRIYRDIRFSAAACGCRHARRCGRCAKPSPETRSNSPRSRPTEGCCGGSADCPTKRCSAACRAASPPITRRRGGSSSSRS